MIVKASNQQTVKDLVQKLSPLYEHYKVVKDENDLKWIIFVYEKDVYLSYVDWEYFKESLLFCQLENGQVAQIEVDGNFVFSGEPINELVKEVYSIVKNNFTDDIYDEIRKLFSKRLDDSLHTFDNEQITIK